MKHGKKYVDGRKADRPHQTVRSPTRLWTCASRRRPPSLTRPSKLHVKLGVDSRHADQQVRGAIVLPNGTGKNVSVCWPSARASRPTRLEELPALSSWATEDMVQKIQGEGWMDFDVVITTPDMMGVVGRLGKIARPPRPDAQPQGRHCDARISRKAVTGG